MCSTAARRRPYEEVVLPVGQRREAVLRIIRSTRKRLLISVFRCTDFPVMDAIADALERGVEVRLLLTPRAKGWEKRLDELGAYLESMGAMVHRYADPVVKYHAKYLLADNGPALIASLNFTAKCFSRTCDFILVTCDPAVVAGLKSLFEIDWLAPDSPFPQDITDRLIIGPDRARTQFTSLLEGARQSIQIIDHKVDDPEIVMLLKAKQAAGVEVQILGQGQLGGLESHGKLVVVDGSKAVLGSVALSALSLDFRREVSVTVDGRCARELSRFVENLAPGKAASRSAGGATERRSGVPRA